MKFVITKHRLLELNHLIWSPNEGCAYISMKIVIFGKIIIEDRGGRFIIITRRIV